MPYPNSVSRCLSALRTCLPSASARREDCDEEQDDMRADGERPFDGMEMQTFEPATPADAIHRRVRGLGIVDLASAGSQLASPCRAAAASDGPMGAPGAADAGKPRASVVRRAPPP